MAFVSILSEYLAQSPLYLVWLAGLLYALLSWRRHPRVSLLALAALTLLTANALISTFVRTWLPGALMSMGRPYLRQMGLILTLRYALQSLVDAAAFGLLLAAVFSSRGERVPAGTAAADRGAA